MTRYLIVIEKTGTGYSAYSPDIDGCIATGKTKASVTKNMREAIEFHIDGLRLEGLPVPKPQSASEYIGIKSAYRTARVSKQKKIVTSV